MCKATYPPGWRPLAIEAAKLDCLVIPTTLFAYFLENAREAEALLNVIEQAAPNALAVPAAEFRASISPVLTWLRHMAKGAASKP